MSMPSDWLGEPQRLRDFFKNECEKGNWFALIGGLLVIIGAIIFFVKDFFFNKPVIQQTISNKTSSIISENSNNSPTVILEAEAKNYAPIAAGDHAVAQLNVTDYALSPYYKLSRINYLGEFDGPLSEDQRHLYSTISSDLKKYVTMDSAGKFRVECSDSSSQAFVKAEQFIEKFPFSAYYVLYCGYQHNEAATETSIFKINRDVILHTLNLTTQFPNHDPSHDALLNILKEWGGPL